MQNQQLGREISVSFGWLSVKIVILHKHNARNHNNRVETASNTLVAVQVYYELEQKREDEGLTDKIAICRVEQLAPFPFDLVMRELKRYPNAQVRIRI